MSVLAQPWGNDPGPDLHAMEPSEQIRMRFYFAQLVRKHRDMKSGLTGTSYSPLPQRMLDFLCKGDCPVSRLRFQRADHIEFVSPLQHVQSVLG